MEIHIINEKGYCTVATGFPAGQTPLHTRLEEIRYAVKEGATEIDIVINRAFVLAANWQGLFISFSTIGLS